MTRVIAICSGKGGAGKTTVTANLGARLAQMGKNVVVLDANLTTPNLGMHFGMPLYPVTLHDVLKGKPSINQAMYEHDNGLKIIPAGISVRDLRGVDARDLPNAMLDLLGNADIVLVDVAAGLGREALSAMEASDELILVANPEMTSVTDALKASKLAGQVGTKVMGVVVNKVRGMRHEMKTEDIRLMLDGLEVLAEIPDDVEVQKSIAARTPVIYYSPKSAAAHSVRRLAAWVSGEPFNEALPIGRRLWKIFFRRNF